MPGLQTVGISLVIVVVMLFLYKYLFNPQVLLLASGKPSTCPRGWKYSDKLCSPTYETRCRSFDPSKVTSKATACGIAQSCGTDWPGKCI
jgi:hypothetical protein